MVAPPAALGGPAGDATPGGFGNATGGFNVNGMRNQSNNFLLDGASNNDTFNTGFVLRPPPDAIQEFKILTHSYSAEYGRNAGSVVNVVTRGGTNELHGAAWEFNRDDALEARNFFAPRQQAQAEAEPVRRQRRRADRCAIACSGSATTRAIATRAAPPTPAWCSRTRSARGNFGGTTIRDPLTGLPFPNNVIPADRISSGSPRSCSNDYMPLPNTTGNRYTESPDVDDDRDQFGVRVDSAISDKHSLLGRYSAQQTDRVDPLGGSNFSPAGNVAQARRCRTSWSRTPTCSPRT